jgi:hypothetical protein
MRMPTRLHYANSPATIINHLTLAIGRLTIHLLRILVDMTHLNSLLETETEFSSDTLKPGLANELDGVGWHLPAK